MFNINCTENSLPLLTMYAQTEYMNNGLNPPFVMHVSSHLNPW